MLSKEINDAIFERIRRDGLCAMDALICEIYANPKAFDQHTALQDLSDQFWAGVDRRAKEQNVTRAQAIVAEVLENRAMVGRWLTARGILPAGVAPSVASRISNEDRISYSVMLSDADGGSTRKRMPVAMVGVRYKGKQKVEITREMLDQVVANFRKEEADIPVDYDHAIRFAAGDGQPVPAAGWLKSVDGAPDGDGILWGGVEWTPRAAQMIATKEYQYISPVLDPNARDRKTGQPQGWTLTSAALTNQPVLTGMPALVLGMGRWRCEGQFGSVDEEIDARVRSRIAQSAGELDYCTAFKLVLSANPDLERRKAATMHGSKPAPTSPIVNPCGGVDEEIDGLVRSKIKQTGGRMDYGEAFKWVLSANPDLARRKAAKMYD